LLLSHYSDRPIKKLRSIRKHHEPLFKPTGLWLSVDGNDDWKHWCEAESFNIKALIVRHQIILNDKNNILLLTTPNEILAFNDQYKLNDDCGFCGQYIDWLKVIKDYQGIIIAPYQWSLRHDLNWYYSWDCASGCIWNKKAIKAIEII